MIIHIFN